MKWLAVLVLILTFSGCTWGERWSLTTADELNEDQMWLTAVVGKQCQQLGVNPWTRFTDDDYLISGDNYGRPGETLNAAMWANVGSNTIIIWNPAREKYHDLTLTWAARHECCHLKLNHRNATAQAEVEAEACVASNFKEGE